MSEIKPLSLSPDPYPKARTHRQVSSKPTSPPRTTNNRPTLDLSYSYPTADRYTPENLAATIFDTLGIPRSATWPDQDTRIHELYQGEPIRELM